MDTCACVNTRTSTAQRPLLAGWHRSVTDTCCFNNSIDNETTRCKLMLLYPERCVCVCVCVGRWLWCVEIGLRSATSGSRGRASTWSSCRRRSSVMRTRCSSFQLWVVSCNTPGTSSRHCACATSSRARLPLITTISYSLSAQILPVVWHCWLGVRKSVRSVNKWSK